MTGFTVVTDPLLSPLMIAILAGAAALMGVIALKRRVILRLIAVAALAGALANPSLVREEREPLPDVVVLAVDESESMSLRDRPAAAAAAAEAVRAAAANDATLDIIETAVPRGDDGTRLFDALAAALAEAPRGRLAGVVAVTDGRVHDAPDSTDALDIAAPFHALIVGDPAARDRRLEVTRAPQFGIVGQTVSFEVRVDDPAAIPGTPVEVRFSIDGGEPISARARVGETVEVGLELRRRGPNVVEIEAAAAFGELTLANNSAAVSVAGVRDRLRGLLVTGEPHAGARAWRDLLKSDPSVDLVHFTILRPPSKNDGTPTGELSLIAFPTRELFERKLEEFDLVIFDQY
ncbi:MAG: hypothetical protein MI723_19315, partial [Caulobacterales bacterium]|nr:hypothetical protein [Caulobacterales bacterium]